MQKTKLIVSTISLSILLFTIIMPLSFTQAQASSSSWSDLETALQPIIDAATERGIEVSVGVSDLSGTYNSQQLSLGSDGAYYSASTIKMFIIAQLMKEIEANNISLEDKITITENNVVGGAGSLQKESFPQDITVERLARLMITQSDNTATNALIDVLSFEKINELIDSLGFETSQLGRKMMTAAASPAEDNYVNSAELLDLLEMLYDGSLVSSESREHILEWMNAQEVRTKFGAALPDKPIAHKTGELGDVSHDMGYFLEPGKELAVVVLTKVTKPEDAGKAQELGNPIIQRIAKAIYNYMLDTPSPATDASIWPQLSLAIAPLVNKAEKAGIRVSVALQDLSESSDAEERYLQIGSQQYYAPASTIKMALIAALMKEVDAGNLSLDQKVTVTADYVVGGTGSLQHEAYPQDITLERLGRLMITQSDNIATNVLIDVVGLHKVDQLMEELNLEVMHLGRKMFAAAATPAHDNYINSADLVTLLAGIYNHTFLTPESSSQIIEWMKQQEVKTKFGAALDGKAIAHKTGENANVTHDAGYILVPGHELAIAVLTEVTTTSVYAEAQAIGNPIVQEIAAAVYNALLFESKFTDVPAQHWAAHYIAAAEGAGIVNGLTKDHFGPDARITRAEFAAMLARALELKASSSISSFSDITSDQWYAEVINAVKEAGIVNGYGDNTFKPNENISRAELATMIARAYTLAHSAGNVSTIAYTPYSDQSAIPSWSNDAVTQLQQLGFISGYQDGSFRPNDTATRAQAVKWIVALLSE